MSTDAELVAALRLLRQEGYEIKAPPPPPPANACIVCGRTDEENEREGMGPLVDVLVIVADGEEGYADPRRYFCFQHVTAAMETMIRLGFGVHRHGGINYLEPEDCPGYGDMDACPTPVGEDGPD